MRPGAFLLALLMSGLSLAAPPAPRFTWPNPAMLREAEVPGYLWGVYGIPVKLRMIEIRHPAREAFDLYLEAFRRAGFYVAPMRQQPRFRGHPTLTALDTERLIGYTVIFLTSQSRTTQLLLGESNVTLRRSEGAPSVPLFPGAEGMLKSDQEGYQIVSYTVKAREEEVRAFYADVLGKAGFKPGDIGQEPGLFTKSGESLQLLVHKAEDNLVAVSLLRRLTGP